MELLNILSVNMTTEDELKQPKEVSDFMEIP